MSEGQQGHFNDNVFRKKARIQAIVLTLFALTTIISLVFLQKVQADNNAEEAMRQKRIAEKNLQLAETVKEEAEQLRIQLRNCND
jgi:predicted RND superfamily exporter protein